MGTGNPGVTLTRTLKYPYPWCGLGYFTGTGNGFVGFQEYKGCIMGHTLFEEDKSYTNLITIYIISTGGVNEDEQRGWKVLGTGIGLSALSLGRSHCRWVIRTVVGSFASSLCRSHRRWVVH